MSTIRFKTEKPRHFLMDDKGDLYEVSDFLAEQHRNLHPSSTFSVERIDKDTNTIYFCTPLSEKVKAQKGTRN